MVLINLLPWRAHCQRYQKKYLYRVLMVTVLLLIVISLVCHYFLNYRLQFYFRQIQLLDKKIQALHSRKLKPWPSLQGESKKWELLLTKIANNREQFYKNWSSFAVPNKAVCLMQLNYQQQGWQVEGYAYSISSLFQYITERNSKHGLSHALPSIVESSQQKSFLHFAFRE